MISRFSSVLGLGITASVVLLGLTVVSAQTAPPAQQADANAASAKPTPKTPDGHPDLSGIWTANQGRGPEGGGGAKGQRVNGSVIVTAGALQPDGTFAPPPPRGGRGGGGRGRGNAPTVQGWVPGEDKPTYKPEYEAKVKDLYDHQSRTDNVFYCGRPGVPRLGPPQKIVQTKDETIFFYEATSGSNHRFIPTDGRGFPADTDSSFNGDSVGHWEGDTLVVEVRNLTDESWIEQGGYFHTENMRVTERLRRDGDTLIYQAVVDDPAVLAKPWAMQPRLLHLTSQQLIEPLRCKESSGSHLVGDEHHN